MKDWIIMSIVGMGICAVIGLILLSFMVVAVGGIDLLMIKIYSLGVFWGGIIFPIIVKLVKLDEVRK